MNRRRKASNKTSTNPMQNVADQSQHSFKQQNIVALTLAEHKKHFFGSFKRLITQPFANAMTVLVIAIALTLPACLYLLIQNGSELTARWQTSHDISAYVSNTLDQEALNKLQTRIKNRADVSSVSILTATEALEELGKNSDLDLISEALPDNPLPHTFIITPAQTDKNLISQLSKNLQTNPQINSVDYDFAWVIKLNNIMNFLTRLIGFLTCILALGVFLIVANTIRLHVNTRRNEIEVKKLIGASDRFVRRPFLYTGFWYGLLGAGLALALIMFLQLISKGPLTRLLDIYSSSFTLNYFGLYESFLLIGGGTLLALIGAWVAAETSIRAIEPK